MKKILAIINGIMSDQDYFAAILGASRGEPGFQRVKLIQFKHWSPLPFTTAPFMWITNRKARAVVKMINRIRQEYEEKVEINIFGHSYGTLIAKVTADMLKTPVKNLFLAGSVLPKDTVFSDNVLSVSNFYSEDDAIVQYLSYGGKAGRYGFDPEPRIDNIEFAVGHSGYLQRGPLVKMIHRMGDKL